MAVQTADLVVLAQNYAPQIVDQINRSCMTLRTLRIEGPRPGVQTPAWAVEKDGVAVENHAEDADASSFASDAQDAANLPWGLYWAKFSSSDLAQSQGAAALGPEDNVRLWAHNLVRASAGLASKINQEIHLAGNTGTLIRGFGTAIGDDDNIYAGIDRSQVANAYWRPNIFAPGTPTNLSHAVIRSDLGIIKDRSGLRPDLAYTPTDVMNKMKALFDPQRFFVQNLTTARGPVTLDNTVQALLVEGCVFIEEKDAPAGTIEYVNSNVVVVRVLPKPKMGDNIGFQNIQANDGFGNIPLAFAYSKLAKTGSTEKAIVDAQIQLEVERPNACGVRRNIA